MEAISFYLLYPLIWAFSLLPLRILYLFSDFVLYPLLYKVVGYRKKVVRENILSVYPDWSEERRLELEAKFYHYLSDLFIETIKGFSISFSELNKRVSYANLEEFNAYFERYDGLVMTAGHVGNYEWLAQHFPQFRHLKMGVPYRKLTNPYFDKAFRASRERGGATLFHTDKTWDYLREVTGKYLLVLANDQSAPAAKSFWVKFLNRDTSFFEGTEKIARQLNAPVIFVKISVPKRGHYRVSFHPITEDPSKEELGHILNEHARLLEENIHAAPQYWLWSHKRWKHKKPAGFTYGFTRSIS
jgi:KDO2-lipid IV(A) lauroyltransferase